MDLSSILYTVQLILQQMSFLNCKLVQRILSRNFNHEIKCRKVLLEKSISTFTENCRKTISGKPDVISNLQVTLLKVAFVWGPSRK